LISLHLNSGGELSFILDTGAPLTLLDSSLEKGLGKQLGHEKIISMYGQTPSHYYKEPELYWGDVRLHTGRRVLTMDLSQLSSEMTQHTHSSHKFMGILGMDCLWHYSIHLDFAARKIRFLDPSQLHREDLGKSFSLTPDSQGCPITVKEGGSRCVIDTGSIGRSATNVMGLDFLSRYLVTFDFPERKMYLKPATISSAADQKLKTQPNKSRGCVKTPRLGKTSLTFDI
jgi:hypothetical protein